MGRLIDGQWRASDFGIDEEGRFRRQATTFRDSVQPEEVVSGRYRLYVSMACPWAHRTLITRALLGLEEHIPVSVVHWYMGQEGWTFEPGPGVVADPDGATWLREIYLRAKSDFTGRVTVPILWDHETGRIVNNESREIVRMLDDVFAPVLAKPDAPELHPASLHDEIERVADAIYEPINNGVYRAGFARSQEAYDEAVAEVFSALDHWDAVLGRQRFTCGDRLTEADIFLFTTLVRFDLVYHYHFKCNLRRIQDYGNLWDFTRFVYQLPGVRETVDFAHITKHYFGSHESVNPTRIVPIGPEIDFDAPTAR